MDGLTAIRTGIAGGEGAMIDDNDTVDPLIGWRLDDMEGYYPPARGRVYWSVRLDFDPADQAKAAPIPEGNPVTGMGKGGKPSPDGLVIPPLYLGRLRSAGVNGSGNAAGTSGDRPGDEDGNPGMTVYADRSGIDALLDTLRSGAPAADAIPAGLRTVTIGRRITGSLAPAADDGGGSDRSTEAGAFAAAPTEASNAGEDLPDDGDDTCRDAPPAVIMAVIDDGIALGHDLFRDADGGTRIEHAWIMSDRDRNRGAPGTFRGRELTKAEIDAGLVAHTPGGDPRNGLLDEAGFYRDLGLIDFAEDTHFEAAFRRAHGTHVLSLASGRPPGEDDGRMPIIAVQLPARVTEATGGDELLPDLALAIDFILDRARDIDRRHGGRRLPLVLTFSYGNFAGAHDGTDPIARMLTRLATRHRREIRVVLPAGNANLAQAHSVLSFGDDGRTTDPHRVSVDWRVQPDDRTASFVHFWLPYRPTRSETRRLVNRVEVVTPTGQTVDLDLQAPGGGNHVDLLRGGEVFGRLAFQARAGGTRRGRISLMIKPTAHEEARPDLAPHGLWHITLQRGPAIADGEVVHARIQRDDSLPNYPLRGRQSYFEDARFQRFDEVGRPLTVDPADPDSSIRRAGTLSPFAAGDAAAGPIVAGGWIGRDGDMSPYSAGGPATGPSTRRGPDASLVSDDSRVADGVMGAGSHCGSMVAMNGTSVAAPQLARWVAGRLLAGLPADRAAVRQEAAAQEAGFPAPGAPPPEWRGAGRMKVMVFPNLPVRVGS